MNTVCLAGRVVRDPDYRQNGDSGVVKFSIAVDRRFKNADGKYDCDFINCVAFKNTADFIAKYFTKGMRIGVTGRIQTGSYTNKEGVKVYTTDVVVDNAEFMESKKSQNDNNINENEGFKPEINENEGFMNINAELESELPFN